VLIPALRQRPDAVVVMDNLAAHKAERVRAALDAAGIAYRYLPAYSPDLDLLPESGGVRSEPHAAAGMTIASMSALASAGVR